tara:strand:+ start:62 stop:262 length:201 start_codon:yes stop_codon:yes gene_type:complete
MQEVPVIRVDKENIKMRINNPAANHVYWDNIKMRINKLAANQIVLFIKEMSAIAPVTGAVILLVDP